MYISLHYDMHIYLMDFISCSFSSSNFTHHNIIEVLGVCMDNNPIFIIMELMPAGDLLQFLRDAQKDQVCIHAQSVWCHN